ncbi:hypothetical protein HPB48_004475 [Haemaphysalis longicornis]|uniref:Transposable element P transposase-like RNase H C-terminal domain-containing protein n=1 Tax=Haemaphysalis longicornis TaxID=44386 RepID=A0A9J6GGI8_HAELO|nr:hypothetical protein HPB48_004475 [Haemaphysalis longicornis]
MQTFRLEAQVEARSSHLIALGNVHKAEFKRYICTSNLNQDPLEFYFSCVRQRGGWNSHPSAAQFRLAYRKTSVHAAALGSKNANVTPQLEGIALAKSQSTRTDDIREQDAPTTQDDDELLNLAHTLSTYSSEVVRYIGGYIVRTTSKQLHCAECVGPLTSDSISSLLTQMKDNGVLIEPSAFVHAALHAAELAFRHSTITDHKEQVNALTLRSFGEFAESHTTMFEQMVHYSDEPHYVNNMTKVVQRKYSLLRLRSFAKHMTQQSRGEYLRHMLTKRVLFAHQ